MRYGNVLPGWETRKEKRVKRWSNSSLDNIPSFCNILTNFQLPLSYEYDSCLFPSVPVFPKTWICRVCGKTQSYLTSVFFFLFLISNKKIKGEKMKRKVIKAFCLSRSRRGQRAPFLLFILFYYFRRTPCECPFLVKISEFNRNQRLQSKSFASFWPSCSFLVRFHSKISKCIIETMLLLKS